MLVLEVSLRQFDGTVYAQLHQVALIGLPTLASVLLLPALVATAALSPRTLAHLSCPFAKRPLTFGGKREALVHMRCRRVSVWTREVKEGFGLDPQRCRRVLVWTRKGEGGFRVGLAKVQEGRENSREPSKKL